MRNSLSYVAAVLGVAIVVLILLSWVIAAAMPEASIHSLLSPEGIRWFFGHFATSLATPFLVWIVLGTLAYGAFRGSGLQGFFFGIRAEKDYRSRFAWRIVLIEMACFAAILVLLCFTPQAVLLSVTGSLWPSSFSAGLIPILCFAVIVFSVTYGLVSGRLATLHEVVACIVSFFPHSGIIFLLYVLTAELYFSVLFVFG